MSRIADVLVLVMTRGASLTSWRDSGVLAREWALYERLADSYGRVIVASYGDAEDSTIASALPGCPEVVFDQHGVASGAHEARMPQLIADRIAGDERVVVKTNQFQGGDAAVSIVETLRARGVSAALLARGGYDYSRGFAVRFGPESREAQDAADEEARLLARADCVVVTTERIAELLAWRHAMSRERFVVIPNYVDDDTFRSDDMPREKRTVLGVGRLDPQKRWDLLIDACARLDGVRMVVVGDGMLRSSLESRCRAHGLDAEFEGQLDTACVHRWMRTCAVFAQCSVWEGHPKTVLEAQACGAPVIGVHAPGLSEVIEPEVTGLLARAEPGAIACAIERVLENPELGSRLGNGARNAVAEQCALGVVLEQEREAHRFACEAGERRDQTVRGGGDHVRVRWGPGTPWADPDRIARAFGDSVHGLCKRMRPEDACRVVFALEHHLYRAQGEFASAHEGSSERPVHPKHRLTRYHDFFCSHVTSEDGVLDAGCGNGDVSIAIARRTGASVVGVDLQQERIARARSSVLGRPCGATVRFCVGDVTDPSSWHMEDLPARYDVVVLSNVLEHIDDRPGLLRALRERFDPVRVLIRVPAYDRDWRVPFMQELGVEWRLDDDHRLEYTDELLRDELHAAGLDPLSIDRRWGELYAVATPVVSGGRSPDRSRSVGSVEGALP
ncbi:MAG: hypothetical protein Tsb0013_17210 [Phycisphaerales bacterium]